MDAFFASVEQRDFPELKGKALAVGGSGRRGVVAAASYEARKYGVHSAMPGALAKRLCPHLIFVKHRFEVYKEVSRQIRTIFQEYTDLVEPLSLDEAFLDVTENKINLNSGTIIAERIRKSIFECTQLTASAGVSYNKFLAKIASDINKPNGIKVILPEEAAAFIDALPVSKFFGVGKVTQKKMHDWGIFTGADLKARSREDLVQRFGKVGHHYFKISRGIDRRAVNPNRIRKSIGAERTFTEDLETIGAMRERLIPIAERVFEYMKKTDNYGRTLHLKAKSPDFKLFTRSKTFNSELRDLEVFLKQVNLLLDNHYEEFPQVRLLGVSVSNLTKEQHLTEGIQLEIEFGEEP